jgi:Tol biopolymer transport system component
MKLLTFTTIALAQVTVLNAQSGPTPVRAPITTLVTLPAGEDVISGPVGAGGQFVYYGTRTAINAYNRATRKTSVVAAGWYDDLAVSAAGDRLVGVRIAENAKHGTNQPAYVWTVQVNPRTGVASGEPRRVSTLPAGSPAFSPDGKQLAFIATQPSPRLVVMATGGGMERVIVDHVATDDGSPVGAVRWSTDGKAIYFFAPGAAGRPSQGILSRVAATGGTPTPVGITGLMALPPADAEHFVAADQFSENGAALSIYGLDKQLQGRTQLAFDTATGFPCNFGWSGKGLNLLMAMYKMGVSLAAQPVPAGTARTIPLSSLFGDPVLSPDGKHLAVWAMTDSMKRRFAITNIDGSGRRFVPTPDSVDAGQRFVWSPDGSHVVFRADDRRTLYVADVATAKAIKAGAAEAHINEVRWRADSRSLMFIRYDGTETRSKVSVHETTLDGRDRLIRDLSSAIPAEGERLYAITNFLGDSAVLAVQLGLRIPLYGGPPENLYAPIRSASPGPDYGAKPGRSDDGRWIAVPSADKRTSQMISSDGKVHRTIQIPATLTPIDEAYFGPENQSLIVPVRETSNTTLAVYLIPVDGGAPHALVQLAPGEGLENVYLSRDRKTLWYLRQGKTSIALVEADLGVSLKGRTPQKEE